MTLDGYVTTAQAAQAAQAALAFRVPPKQLARLAVVALRWSTGPRHELLNHRGDLSDHVRTAAGEHRALVDDYPQRTRST